MNIIKLEIPVSLIDRIDTASSYNRNYYLMSGVTINECNVLADVRGVSEEFENYEIGHLSNGKFIGRYFLHIDEVDLKDRDASLIIFTEKLNVENLWT